MRAPVAENLAPFCRYLQAHGVLSYVFEREGEQCLCVPAQTEPLLLRQLVESWGSGAIDHNDFVQEMTAPLPDSPTVFSQWQRFPVTLLLCVMSLLTFLLVATAWGQASGGLQWLARMTLQSLQIEGEEVKLLAQLPPLVEAWRFWTPIFLHFSLSHILFNSLMLLELGRRIEMAQGALRLLFVVMACGLISNLTQFYVDADTLFGGMSGVIYALAGYSWLYQRLRPESGVIAPPGLMVMALIWLVLCFSGLITAAGMGQIANAAHVGGLLAGLALAALLALLDKALPPGNHHSRRTF